MYGGCRRIQPAATANGALDQFAILHPLDGTVRIHLGFEHGFETRAIETLALLRHTSVAAALVSCLGEGLERLSQIERRGDAAPYRPAAKDRVGIDATIADWLSRSFGDIAVSDRR